MEAIKGKIEEYEENVQEETFFAEQDFSDKMSEFRDK